jgi:hypothetical protein
MAKPRVFISSTFYDLRQIRVELDKFIEGLGYEPVRNEEGDIPYGKDEALQAYCYKEIANIDVLVSIIGSRYGSAGIIKEKEQEYSVSQLELKTALKEDKQVFVFIDKNVFTEYETYILNKNNENVIYKYVDNVNIYKFIEEIKALPHNNNIKGFETAEDITSYLREQFAGLFKQFMLDNKRVKETLIIRDIENTAKTLRELVDYLKEDSQGKDEEINRIIRINHPMVGRLKELLNIHYNIYIEEKRDLEALLKARGYKFNPIEECWERTFNNELLKLFISEDLFENDKLKYIKASDWSDDFIKLEKAFLQKDDDLPF